MFNCLKKKPQLLLLSHSSRLCLTGLPTNKPKVVDSWYEVFVLCLIFALNATAHTHTHAHKLQWKAVMIASPTPYDSNIRKYQGLKQEVEKMWEEHSKMILSWRI